MTTQTPADEGRADQPSNGGEAARWLAAVARFHAGYTVDPVTGCWVWQGKPDGEGYGRFTEGGRRWFAHRFSLHLHCGSIPEGLSALHGCDNRLCVNPAHLRAGTAKQNAQDAKERGRLPKGPGSRPRKLSGRDANTIIGMKMLGFTLRQVADAFGTSTGAIKAVLSGKAWTAAMEADFERWAAEEAAQVAGVGAVVETVGVEATEAETIEAVS